MIALSIAAKKGWITEDDVKKMLPESMKAKPVYDQFENLEDREPDD